MTTHDTPPDVDGEAVPAPPTEAAPPAPGEAPEPARAGGSARPLEEGELILLVDQKSRNYLVRLASGQEFQTHTGVVPHDEMIGRVEGERVASTKGQKFRIYRPTLSEYILNMRRGAQVIYPKDIGPILLLADITPGCRVFESGVGSGALSMAMLRAGAHITGYELREDFAGRARRNVSDFLGEESLARYEVHIRSSYETIDHDGFDRVVLDLPEPWQVVPRIAERVRPGAILVSYSPSITQVMRARDALERHGFGRISTTEVLHRTWHIEGAAVRPDHRMVAHTGFLTSARAHPAGE